ncbi:methionine ABC transporter ATP-binding protein [Mycobacterium sp. DL592]|uniref:methionine ABC transporter ATP-binding protein n=1 Tax=Mycobacterium sp. DL592 TaxID=2675524 RepID=UPI0014216D6E|nr:methionine ABC transporter ATP-binding protein [Mycobacterium sp. DL592]
MAPIVEFVNVTKTYPVEGSKETFNAVESISLTIESGSIYAIIGGSGAGKSTLVRLINALERPTSGQVIVEGTDITTLTAKQTRELRTRIGMVFQQFNLLNSRTVYGNIAFALESAGVPKESHRDRIAELLHFVGLAEKAWAFPRQLSGGQKQRVGIARALAANPKILLADEATSALDPQTTNDVLRLLQRVNADFGITVIVITHEMDVVRKIADRVAVLDRGELVEEGDVYTIFSEPQAELTTAIVSNSLHDKPSPTDAAELSARYPGKLVAVSVADQDRVGAILADAVRSTDVGFEFVYGGISALQGRSVGNITLALTGSDSAVEQVVTELRSHTTVQELG